MVTSVLLPISPSRFRSASCAANTMIRSTDMSVEMSPVSVSAPLPLLRKTAPEVPPL